MGRDKRIVHPFGAGYSIKKRCRSLGIRCPRLGTSGARCTVQFITFVTAEVQNSSSCSWTSGKLHRTSGHPVGSGSPRPTIAGGFACLIVPVQPRFPHCSLSPRVSSHLPVSPEKEPPYDRAKNRPCHSQASGRHVSGGNEKGTVGVGENWPAE